MSWTFYNASGQRLSSPAVSVATQAEMEAASSTTIYVTPGRAHYHPSAAKAYCFINADGSLGSGDYNVASITDTAVGNRTVVWDVDFSDTNYAVLGSNRERADRIVDFSSVAAGSVVHQIRALGAPHALGDEPSSVAGFGDQ
tara:strand:+ start:408 stop:833 length:426 start_codon:yes stop_codon:yes gene_type:complete